MIHVTYTLYVYQWAIYSMSGISDFEAYTIYCDWTTQSIPPNIYIS